MVLFGDGRVLTWPETKQHADVLKEKGIQQFINQYQKIKDRQGDCLKWGDEIEYVIVKFDHNNRRARLSLRSTELLSLLNVKGEADPKEMGSVWQTECSEFMLESTPGRPYQHFNMVERNMRFRRSEVERLLEADEVLLTLANFPRLGCVDFTFPSIRPDPINGFSRSLFFPEDALAKSHPVIAAFEKNIHGRRKEKFHMNVPVYVDLNTPRPFVEDLSKYGGDENSISEAMEDHIYLDAMGCGSSCCGLQITIQAGNFDEARVLHDNLTPLCPIMLALTAASPIYRGYLADVDCRWDVVCVSLDCRTREERGLEPLKNDKFVIPKSRFDSVGCYMSKSGSRYNDVLLPIDKTVEQKLMDNKVDQYMAQYIAHLFVRDPITVFDKDIHQDVAQGLGHYVNMQNTIWPSVRFKIPSIDENIGWRIEFRPCEVQMTDFMNAAFEVFIVLLTRAILTRNISILIPMSKVDENMKNCQKRNAVLDQKLWFRRDLFSQDSDEGADTSSKMTVTEIINGKGDDFVGLIPLVRQYLATLDMDVNTASTIDQYLNFISARAEGTAMTTATWIRKFVTSHPEYKQDSVISEGINYDLLVACSEITQGKRECHEMLGGIAKMKTSV